MKKLHIVHLYPAEMNIYGDIGNRIVLEQRLAWRSMPFEVSLVGIGDKIPKSASIILGGGGQDSGQELVEKDLHAKRLELQAMADNGVVMLMICGMYQLFGEAFITKDNKTIKGIGILPVYTEASDQRMIGNVLSKTAFGDLVGYENHSGKTYLEENCMPLGRTPKGQGNNGSDRTEGARINNVFASYLHGPVLSKNPFFADELIKLALRLDNLKPLDDQLEMLANSFAKTRPR